jgi:hypothetical protein
MMYFLQHECGDFATVQFVAQPGKILAGGQSFYYSL